MLFETKTNVQNLARSLILRLYLFVCRKMPTRTRLPHHAPRLYALVIIGRSMRDNALTALPEGLFSGLHLLETMYVQYIHIYICSVDVDSYFFGSKCRVKLESPLCIYASNANISIAHSLLFVYRVHLISLYFFAEFTWARTYRKVFRS